MGTGSRDGSTEEMRLRDEILEAGYWMLREERIESSIGASDLQVFVGSTGDSIESAFERMASDGLFEQVGDGYDLTERGEYEAKRRFVDSFGDLEEGHNHVECGPDCWCHDLDSEEACHTEQL
jgi:Mn-dependent DtxR family transcriptional regulator